jgi:hypothetical protein
MNYRLIPYIAITLILAITALYYVALPRNSNGQSVPPTVPAALLEYTNDAFGFSLVYPEDLQVSTFDEGDGASTIVFQNVGGPDGGARGFQIFVVPYGAGQMHDDQPLTQELPSIRTELQEITIDGASGVAFYSATEALGDTHEIWFIHEGSLYEVTTLRVLEPWLSEIMQTWQFI